MRIAMISPPWVRTPPVSYGGIEYLVHHLTIELERMGHEVALFATGDSTTPATEHGHVFESGQYDRISDPLHEAVGIPLTQVVTAVERACAAGDVDVIHDHTAPLGAALLSFADPRRVPPSLHTLHGPFVSRSATGRHVVDDRGCYAGLGNAPERACNGISRAQLQDAPATLRRALLGVVHNGISLDEFPFRPDRSGPFVTLARICRSKGHATAARLCDRMGAPLRIAGMVPGYQHLGQLAAATSSDGNGDLAYFLDEVRPLLRPGAIELTGLVGGDDKHELLRRARALLMPIEWDEPFGLAAIEALACGTPVVAMRRGALPEIIEHGVNGFLADTEDEFEAWMHQVDRIDPTACRSSVATRFSTARMARDYVRCYERLLDRAARPAPRRTATPAPPAVHRDEQLAPA